MPRDSDQQNEEDKVNFSTKVKFLILLHTRYRYCVIVRETGFR